MKTHLLKNTVLFFAFVSMCLSAKAQQTEDQTAYKKRVLETTEVDLLSSYYGQDGNNAAVSGGLGTEELTDATGTIIVSIPLNDDDVLTIDGGVSAYTSASSSNVDPFDTTQGADPFVASSGASGSDLWSNFNVNYSHSSDDRNRIWTAKASVANEYDYFSVGFGGSYNYLFNEKNTELGIKANVYLDQWKAIYPIELRPFAEGGEGMNNFLFLIYAIEGNANYNPNFTEFDNESRNSYSVGFNFSQILSRKLQTSVVLDLVSQNGLLSTPFQRVYFTDKQDSFIEDFQLADDIERLPDSRFKIAAGARLNYYVNEFVVLRSFYRYYTDNWGINSHTASLEVPIKLGSKFTVYPSYRFYQQTAADYFAPYEMNLSTDEFYTSDYDLSDYTANQFGIGVSYTDIFTKFNIWKLGLKSIDIKYDHYDRDTGLKADIITAGIKFVQN